MEPTENSPFAHDHYTDVLRADIDANNHANNIVYLRWVQDAATNHWQTAVPAHIANPHTWVVVRHEIDYKKAAYLGDRIRVHTWVATMSALTSERHCRIYRDSDNTLLASVKTRWCSINPATARPSRLDPRIPACFGL
ncbi:MAG: acyl-CoA thioesterase [Puniceicoccales bacterium]|jgi:acyl-CoA thioester hydrolase|nr:acyl-CoA thioesterase [Puniceicoccales bacterium]